MPLIELEAETSKEMELRLFPSLDMLKIKDKKDRGTITVQVFVLVYDHDYIRSSFFSP